MKLINTLAPAKPDHVGRW